MNVKINGVDYPLYFGLDFMAYLNKGHTEKQGEYSIGRGLYNALVQIDEGDPAILVELILAATVTNETQPSEEDVKRYIETEADIEKLVADFLSEFETANATKLAVKRLRVTAEALTQTETKKGKPKQ